MPLITVVGLVTENPHWLDTHSTMNRRIQNRISKTGKALICRIAPYCYATMKIVSLFFLVSSMVIVMARGSKTTGLIEDPGGKAMRHFYDSLEKTAASRADKSKPVAITRIIHYGDSHIAADILTGALRRQFKQDFGDAGPGYTLTGRPWSWYAPSGVVSGTSPGWHMEGLRQSDLTLDGEYGLAGISFRTDKAGEWIKLSADCRSFDIYMLAQPQGGEVELRLDGSVYGRRVSLDSENYAASYLEVDADETGLHTIEIRTLTNRPVRLFGVDIERGSPGVIYDALGINGARVNRLLGWDWQILSSNIKRRDPDLIIVAYGSNEIGDADLDLNEYRQNLTEILKRLHKAAPKASLLVIAPPDRAVRVGRRWQTIGILPEFVKIQRQVALASGAAFWDLFHAMGGSGAITRWASQSGPFAQHDHVHLTSAGYKYVSDLLYAELMRGYATFEAARFSRILRN